MWFQFCAGPGFFWSLSLCVVTKVAPVGARSLWWEALLNSERRGFSRCKRRPLCICSQKFQR
ncbi:hypothetical protein FZN16_08690 [Escherichia coli]|nr:hypothetical protein [Escherichia coli]EEV6139360.1 hypothetical protein [Escherichia coli]EFC4369130.1 hypothetical protein [Escherichia coli]EFC6967057.1 hypothetical protein [Escherichia coli]EFE2080566.1 hypothetical protein [Escherichia coli]